MIPPIINLIMAFGKKGIYGDNIVARKVVLQTGVIAAILFIIGVIWGVNILTTRTDGMYCAKWHGTMSA